MPVGGPGSLPALQRLAVVALALCSGHPGAAAVEPPASARELHAAECVAALEARAEALAAQIRAGQADLRPRLLTQLQFGAAFIGSAYLKGDRDEARSQALLDEARERLGPLSAQDLRIRQAACAEEGARLLAQANALSRAVVNRVARRKMDRMLGR
jgi:hypothetical protein